MIEKKYLKTMRKLIVKRYLECYKKADLKHMDIDDEGVDAVINKVVEDEVLGGVQKSITDNNDSKEIAFELADEISSYHLGWKEEAKFIYKNPIWGRVKFLIKYLAW